MSDRLYHSFREYLAETFGARVWRVPLDAGFSCPNRDGTTGCGGCIFCSAAGSGANTIDRGLSVAEQLVQGKRQIATRRKVDRFLAYYQAFTNTYAAAEQLRQIYRPAVEDPQVVGLAIGTRPDCLPPQVLDLLAEIAKSKVVWLELGLQSANDRTLERINRGHDYETFARAVSQARGRGLQVAAHVIVGLPGEDRSDIIYTAQKLADLQIDAIKIHSLHVVAGTELAQMHQSGNYEPITREYYIESVCDILELLPESTVIMRLTGEAPEEELIAPQWVRNKSEVIEGIKDELRRRRTRQGFRYKHHGR